MKNFFELDFKKYDFKKAIDELTNAGKVFWRQNQICLNAPLGREEDASYGVGSLEIDFENSTKEIDFEGNEKIIAPLKENPHKEEDFDTLCTVFQNTVFEEALNELKTKYNIGRTRLMNMQTRYAMSWHYDYHDRIHYPIKTQDGCLMVIGDEVKHLEQDTWYWTKTSEYHTAVNGSTENRIHLVACIIN